MKYKPTVLPKGLLIFFIASGLMTQAHARDTRMLLPINGVIKNEAYEHKINSDIALYFGDQKHPNIAQSLGQYVANKKTNGFKKVKSDSCQWAMLSAIISLQDRAVKEGGNAVINIESFYKKKPFSSKNEYECHAGNIVVGVALRGKVVSLKKN